MNIVELQLDETLADFEVQDWIDNVFSKQYPDIKATIKKGCDGKCFEKHAKKIDDFENEKACREVEKKEFETIMYEALKQCVKNWNETHNVVTDGVLTLDATNPYVLFITKNVQRKQLADSIKLSFNISSNGKVK